MLFRLLAVKSPATGASPGALFQVDAGDELLRPFPRRGRCSARCRSRGSRRRPINEGVVDQVRDYTPNSDTNFTIPAFKFSVFFLALLQELAKFVDNILSNHSNRVSSANQYLWIWEIIAEPGSPEDEKRCGDFWESVVRSARKMMKDNIRQTENHGLVSSAYSYLRANFGSHVRDAYTHLKQYR